MVGDITSTQEDDLDRELDDTGIDHDDEEDEQDLLNYDADRMNFRKPAVLHGRLKRVKTMEDVLGRNQGVTLV